MHFPPGADHLDGKYGSRRLSKTKTHVRRTCERVSFSDFLHALEMRNISGTRVRYPQMKVKFCSSCGKLSNDCPATHRPVVDARVFHSWSWRTALNCRLSVIHAYAADGARTKSQNLVQVIYSALGHARCACVKTRTTQM